MSGMRPSGRLHLGHLAGVLTQWVELSRSAEAFFEVADLHALTTGYEHTEPIKERTIEMVLDWLAAGVDPQRAIMYVQSHVPEISELHLLLSMIVPVAWLQRVPTYKEQIAALGPEIATYGFLGYPLMQLCDIAVDARQHRSRRPRSAFTLGVRARSRAPLQPPLRAGAGRAATRAQRISRRSRYRQPQDVEVVR